jgi:hypothetical protein
LECIGELRIRGLLARQVLRQGFRDLMLLMQALPRAERAEVYAELPRTLQDALQASFAGELTADFLVTQECMARARERFIADSLAVLILADQSVISRPS